MKFILIITMYLFIPGTTLGQLNKSTWLIGGSGSFYSYNEDFTAPSVSYTGKYTNIDVSTSIGYFLANKFSAGLRPYLSIYNGTSSGGGNAKNTMYAIGPFVRYYFLKDEKEFNLLADLSYQFGINKANNGDKPKGKYNVFSAMAGTELFFNSSTGLEILLGYKSQLVTFENSPSAYRSKRNGFQASIGFQFHLQKN